ncbi:hypothetical protein NKR23_g6516 [Pleurostoma richardsiae]|uniref:Uncharacterized protein n=1 Tax=Pleurostoma richardsiae TaxID=41990 RepID=A0AA38RKE5_9PEZI|nr:hypothetical protein NKR23_g6516 [Pleurostoma richardsiae]
MFGQVYRSGYVDVAKAMPSAPEGTALLPLSERPLLTLYTGQQLLDTLIALANIMFANVVDGSTPQLSLYAVQFGGQLVPVFAVMMVESLRDGISNHNSDLWGYLMQMIGYARTMPVYCCFHLLTSPAATSDVEAIRPRSVMPLNLRAVVPPFSLGYGLLSFLFAYPFSSRSLRQWLCAIWQGFPHYVVGMQYLVSRFLRSRESEPLPSSAALPETRHRDSKALSRVYGFAFGVAAVRSSAPLLSSPQLGSARASFQKAQR